MQLDQSCYMKNKKTTPNNPYLGVTFETLNNLKNTFTYDSSIHQRLKMYSR